MIDLVVVSQFDAQCVSRRPDKTDPPLVVDADTILSFAITGQFFQPVATRNSQIVNSLGRIDHVQFPLRGTLNRQLQARHTLASKDLFGLPIVETFDHAAIIT